MNTRHETHQSSRLQAASIVVAVLLTALDLSAQADVMTVGTVTADLKPASVVDVPIYLRDLSGTLIGDDQGLGLTIQMISVTVEPSPATSVASITIERAGLVATPTPTFEYFVTSGDRQSIIVSFDENIEPLYLTLDAPAPGDWIATALVTLSANVHFAEVITLNLIAATSAVSNGEGTVSETVANGSMSLVAGSITLTGLFADNFESGDVTAWSFSVP